MHQEEKDAAKGQKGAWRSRDGEYARDVVERGCNGRKRGPVIAGTDVMLVLQSFCFQHQQSCLRGYKGCLGDILSLSVDQSPLQLCFPALYWARAALRPLITSQRLDLTVSREDGLLCSRLQAGGINGRMTLILSGTGAIRSLVASCLLGICIVKRWNRCCL